MTFFFENDNLAKMTNLEDFKRLKFSRLVCRDLAKSLEVIDSTIKELEKFKVYKPVARVLMSLKEERHIINVYYEKYREIRRKKGKE